VYSWYTKPWEWMKPSEEHAKKRKSMKEKWNLKQAKI
jgi:hypothetical protein